MEEIHKHLIHLTETSERMQEIQKEKRDLLMPYLFVGFILMGTTGFTTLLVIDSFADIAQESQNLSNLEVPNLWDQH